MKKKVLSLILFVFLILNFSLIFAQNDTIQSSAYSCLEDKVEGECSSLTFEQQIFSLLAIGECKDEVLDNLDFDDTKLTAQAILALGRSNTDTSEAEEWLLSQNGTPETMEWLLQIESIGETTCTITYQDSSYSNILLREDKTLIGNAGSCLTQYGGDYWFRIDSDCYGEEFSISCQDPFSTNLLYKKTDGQVFYVSGVTSTASSGGATKEQVNSFCFEQGGTCDYEASLWAALVLDFKGYEISSYLPYLITMKDDFENQQYLPESFLYSLTGDFKGELLDTALPVSGNRYYDTSVAFLPFQGETLDEKTTAISWLESVQGNDGCWNGGNIRDTAFVLYSLWPRAVIGFDEGLNCELSGYFCMSPISCSADAGGDILDEYNCFGTERCCSQPKPLESCEVQGGEVCSSDQRCSISTAQASDTEECCLGSCIAAAEQTQCEIYVDGNCRTSCYSDEEEKDYECDAGRVCCAQKTTAAKKSYWWIWLLLVLIILTVLGIVFRDKLKPYWLKIKSKFKGFGKGKGPKTGPGPRPGFPPARPGVPPRRIPGRPLPPGQRPPLRSQAGRPPKGEIDDVLKKLKEMGK